MFSKYWRSYPWYFQLLQLIILIAIMTSFFALGLGSVLVPKLTGYSLTDIAGLEENSPYMMKQAALLWQFLFSFGTFLVPPLLFAYATHPRPAAYLGLKKPGKNIHWAIVPCLMLGLTPVLMMLSHWVGLLPWGAETKAAAEKLQEVTKIFTSMETPGEFMKILFLMAILPALGEEMFFRGVMMRFAAKRSTTMVFPVIISTIMFAFVHNNTYGLVSIILAGVVLALIYYWTGSLWLSILGHFLNNGVQIILLYIAGRNEAVSRFVESDEVPLSLFFGGLIVAATSLWLLWKHRTPLPNTWSEDYTQEELMEEGK